MTPLAIVTVCIICACLISAATMATMSWLDRRG